MSKIPDFGWHEDEHEGVKLTCRYMVPGLTMHDLVMIFEQAKNEATLSDDLQGNPSKWGVVRGVNAVTEAILNAIYK